MSKIFISYRREDSADVTGRLGERLREHFGDVNVFTDADDIPPGVDFRVHIEQAINQCDVLLAVIGKDWLGIKNANDERRLDEPADFVRVEIESALKRGIPVIPLMVRGASVPEQCQLPGSIRELAFRNALPVRPDPDFNNDADRLVRTLEKTLKSPKLRGKVVAWVCLLSIMAMVLILLMLKPAIESALYKNSFEPVMVRIEHGDFEQESRNFKGEAELPVKQVQVETFELGRYEVTVGQFRAFVEKSGYRTDAERNVGDFGCQIWDSGERIRMRDRNWRSTGFDQDEHHPVVCVSWNDAQAYIDWLNENTSGGYRLPGEAEWAYAARTGEDGAYGFTLNDPAQCDYANGADSSVPDFWYWAAANCDDGHVYTAEVGSYQANVNSIYDMQGNAWEWVDGCRKDIHAGAQPDTPDRSHECDDGRRLLRGGSWEDEPARLLADYPLWLLPHTRYSSSGFRVARTIHE